MIEKLRELLGGRKPATAQQLREAEAVLAAELQQAEAQLDALLDGRASRVLSGLADGDQSGLDGIRAQVAAAQQRVAELADALKAAQGRRKAAEKAQEADALTGRWKRTREALEARNEAAGRLQAALDQVLAELATIAELEQRIRAETPKPFVHGPAGWGSGLGPLALRYLAGRSPLFVKFLPPLESAHAVRHGLTLVDQIRRGSDTLLIDAPKQEAA